MKIVERQFEIPYRPTDWIEDIQKAVGATMQNDETILRVVVTKSTTRRVIGEYLALIGNGSDNLSIFSRSKRPYEDTSSFNTVVIVPTGIGAAIGGHDGDAGPIVKLFGAMSDTVVTHPNVVNASDINEMPENTMYCEGSVLTRMLMGQVALVPARNNRVLVVIDDDNPFFTNAAINAVNAAHASYGFICPKVVKLKPSFSMVTNFSKTGRATGELDNIDRLFRVLDAEKGNYDAVALSTHMTMPEGYRDKYFAAPGNIVNLWGGAESMLTHAVSGVFGVPSAHSPMALTNDEILWDEIAEPRLAAETVSITFLQCILKGLQRSPKIIDRTHTFGYEQRAGWGRVFDASNVSVLVIPDGCIGLPTLAALQQGIQVIAVRENTNLMDNDLDHLPWAPGQFHRAQSYLNAAGIALAIKAGIGVDSVRRPIHSVPVTSSGSNGGEPK